MEMTQTRGPKEIVNYAPVEKGTLIKCNYGQRKGTISEVVGFMLHIYVPVFVMRDVETGEEWNLIGSIGGAQYVVLEEVK